jgi:hypothetical protein
MPAQYTHIRFIGYAIPTTPANLIQINNAMAGTYVGLADMKSDIEGRVKILISAITSAYQAIHSPKSFNAELEEHVINVFVAPEFFFHGPLGPYVFGSDDVDPIAISDMPPNDSGQAQQTAGQKALAEAFNTADYKNWMFVFGTAITAKVDNLMNILDDEETQLRNRMVQTLSKEYLSTFGPSQSNIFGMLTDYVQACHAWPLVQIRDRALILSNIPIQTAGRGRGGFEAHPWMTTEKYFASFEDLILYSPNGGSLENVITEQMMAYPAIDLSNGDLKLAPFDQYAIFRQDRGNGFHLDCGVEICLDHADYRLRRNVGRQPFPAHVDGIHVQIIPSCGMCIQRNAVAADADGFVFNCDGAHALGGGVPAGQCGVYHDGNLTSIHIDYSFNSRYGAHTQLARVLTPAEGGNPTLGMNPTYQPLDCQSGQAFPVENAPDVDQFFVAGPGAVHVYGPYVLYPSQNN